MNTTPFYAFWADWFSQADAEKRKHLRTPGNGGYYPMASEQPGYTGTPDAKSYFHWRINQQHPDSGEGVPEEVETATQAMFLDCADKAEAWCDRHGLKELNRAVRLEDCVLRILHYPSTPEGAQGQAHVDFDLLTVTVPGTVPGLEVLQHSKSPLYSPEGEWERREIGEVHVGEMLEIYTQYQSHTAWEHRHETPFVATKHRVRVPPNTERFSAAFFYLPPEDFELRPGFTARDYLYGPNGVLNRAGTAKVGVE